MFQKAQIYLFHVSPYGRSTQTPVRLKYKPQGAQKIKTDADTRLGLPLL